MNRFRRTINAVSGTALFLVSVEISDFLVHQRREKRLKEKIFNDVNNIDNNTNKLQYQPSYFYKEFINIRHRLTQSGEIAAIDRYKDLIKQSYSLSKELPILINNIDKNLYDILNIILKNKHINNDINKMNTLSYNDKMKNDVTIMLAEKHGIVINNINPLDNIDSIDASILSFLSNFDDAQSFIKTIEDTNIDDKYRVVPLNHIDTFCRNDFLNIINNNNSTTTNDQKTLAIKLIQERNRLVVDLSAEFANYFESILEQKDLVIFELTNDVDIMNDLELKIILSVMLGFLSTVWMDLFFYSRVTYSLGGLKEWIKTNLQNMKRQEFSWIGRIVTSNGYHHHHHHHHHHHTLYY